MINYKKCLSDLKDSLDPYEIFINEDNIINIEVLIDRATPAEVVDFETSKFMLYKATCPSCGYDVHDRAAFCSKCGHKLKW